MEEEKEIIVLQSQNDFIVLSASEIEGPQLVERAENVQVIKVQDKNEKVSKKNFVCTQCTASYTRNLSLQRHINGVHLKLKQYKCTFDNCDFSTAWSSELNSHRDTKHYGVKRFKCSICDFKAYKSSNLNRHLNSAHLKGKYSCKFCNKTLTRLDCMKKHMKDCQSDFIIPASEIEVSQVVGISENVQVFKVHGQNEDISEIEVPQVVSIAENVQDKNYDFENDPVLSDENSFIHTDSITIKEESLDTNFKAQGQNESNSEMEVAQVIDITENVHDVFKVQGQDKDNTETGIAQVVEITENDEVQDKKVLKKNFVCSHCTASYTRNLDLQKHINGVHLNFKQYKCTYEGCDYSTAWKSGLNSHRDTKHHNVKRFKCSICNFEAYKSGNLNRHLDSVHYKRKYQCKFCNKSVTRSDRMKKHMKDCKQKYN